MKSLWVMAAALGAALSLPAQAQDKVKLVDVIELSGAGAAAGTNWKNGADMAAADINAKGGILGKPVEIVHYDTQTNPGNTRAAVQRAIDEGTYAVLGPVFSGPIGASMQIAQRAEIAQLVGGAGVSRVGLGVVMDDLDLLAEDAALGVDVGDGEVDAVLPVGAGGRASAREFDDVDQLDLVLRQGGQADRHAERGGDDPVLLHARFLHLSLVSQSPPGDAPGRLAQAACPVVSPAAVTESKAAPIAASDASRPVKSRKASTAW